MSTPLSLAEAQELPAQAHASTDAPPSTATKSNDETIESVIRGQRRIKGNIVSIDAAGKCKITSELGEFPFALTAVKENKRFPGRLPRTGDRCDFKLSDTNPVKATSIRVIVPKTELTVVGSAAVAENAEEGRSESVGQKESSSYREASQQRSEYRGGASSSSTAMGAVGESLPTRNSPFESSCSSSVPNCVTATSLQSFHSSSERHGGAASNNGIDDLCSALQRFGGSGGSLFSN